MTRTIKISAKGKDRDYGVQSMQITVKLTTIGLTNEEVNTRVEGLRNEFFNVARIYFNVSQIKQ